MWKLTAPLIVLFLTAIFLFLAATNIQGGWLYFVDALLWSVVVLGAALPLLQMRSAEISRRLKGEPVVGQPLTLQTQLKSTGRMPMSFMNLTEYAPLALRAVPAAKTTHPKPDASERVILGQSFVDNLKRGETHQQESKYTPEFAGLHVFSQAQTGSFGPLGLMGVYRRHRAPYAFVVKPALPLFSLKVNAPELQQALKVAYQKSQQPEDISHFRDYQTGDSRRSIHWRNSARQQNLVVGETRQEPLQRASLWINVHAQQSREVALQVMEQATKVAHLLNEQQLVVHGIAPEASAAFWQAYDLATPQRNIPDLRQWEGFATWLAYLEQDAAEGFNELSARGLHQSSLKVVVTDRVPLSWLDVLSPQPDPVICFCIEPPDFSLPAHWTLQRF
jgi:uncharacterized protein (DUF58 family)